MNNHVIRALHEGAVNGQKRFQPLGGESTGKECGVLFGDPDIVAARRMPLGEVDQTRASRHRRSDGNDLIIVVGEVRQLRSKKLGVGRRGGGDGFAGVQMEFSKSMKLVGLLHSRRVAFSLLCEHMENDGLILCF